MKKRTAVFLGFVPCGLVATLFGLYTAYWSNQTRCPDLTFGFMWELVPVSAYVFLFPVSIVLFDSFLESHGEGVFSFYGVAMWGALAHGIFLSPLVFMIFPAERFFLTGATCGDYGENYFSSVIAPFLVAQSLVWLASIVAVAWIGSERLKKT